MQFPMTINYQSIEQKIIMTFVQSAYQLALTSECHLHVNAQWPSGILPHRSWYRKWPGSSRWASYYPQPCFQHSASQNQILVGFPTSVACKTRTFFDDVIVSSFEHEPMTPMTQIPGYSIVGYPALWVVSVSDQH